MTKVEWIVKASEWKAKYKKEEIRKKKWIKRYRDCKEALEDCGEKPDPLPRPSKAIKSLTIVSGRTGGQFIVNGKPFKPIGVFKREAFVVGAGTFPKEINYTYAELKSAFFKSKANYFRVIAPLDLVWFRKEIIDYLNHGKLPHVELYDTGKSLQRSYQANWLDTFDRVKDLPIIFDAMNEFMDYNYLSMARDIVNYVVNHGGLVSAGAWGASNHGEEYAKEFKAGNNKNQAADHHQKWNRADIIADREPGKPLMWSEIHTRDNNLEATKRRLLLGVKNCEAVQVYSLLNFGMGPGSKFQKILDYASSLVCDS